MRILAIVLVLGLSLGLAPASAASFTVTASDFAWTPSALEIAVGDSVTFALGGGSHSWVRDDGTDSCALPCTRTFAAPATIAYHCGVHPFMTGTLQVGPGLAVSIATPAAGAIVSGLVRVEGTATHPTDDIASVTVRIGAGAPVDAEIVGAGKSVSWRADVDTLALADGAQDVVARAEAGAASKEARVDVRVDNPDRIDLQTTALSSPSGAAGSSSVTFSVRNGGNVPSGAFRVRAEYLYQGEWRAIGEASVASLASGSSRTATIAWSPGASAVLVGQFTVRATADPDALVNDVDRANNARTASAGWITSALPGIDLLDPV